MSDVTGILVETGDSITLKLPSSKIKINKPFVIAEGTETTFVCCLPHILAISLVDITSTFLPEIKLFIITPD